MVLLVWYSSSFLCYFLQLGGDTPHYSIFVEEHFLFEPCQ